MSLNLSQFTGDKDNMILTKNESVQPFGAPKTACHQKSATEGDLISQVICMKAGIRVGGISSATLGS